MTFFAPLRASIVEQEVARAASRQAAADTLEEAYRGMVSSSAALHHLLKIVEGDNTLSAADLDHAEKFIGRLAHQRAREETPPSPR